MLPEGWKEVPLEKLANIERGKFSARPRNDLRFYNGTTPFVQTGDISSSGTYLKKYTQTLNDAGVKVSKVFPKGTILITIAANIGDSAITQFDVACPDSIVGIQCYPEKSNEIWLKFKLDTLKKTLDNDAGKNAQKNINLQVLKPLKILTPPLPEQEKIAAILSTWDKAISTADAMLENSRQQKKALMQQLLTGKRRLPGFSGEWELVKLKKIGTTYAGLTGKSKEDFGQGTLFIPYLNVFKNSFVDNTNFEKVIIYDNEKQNCVKYGDILFTISSETPHEVGMSSVFLDHIENVYLNSFCFGFRMKNFSILLPQYARFLFRGKKFRGNIASLAQGATRYNLSKTQFLEIAVLLPPLDEQRAIAAVLDAADREIALLEQKAARLREEKKALMQQLLTGKRRVKI